MYIGFLYYEKSFDRVNHERFSYPDVKIIGRLYLEQAPVVHNDGGQSNCIEIHDHG